MKRFFIAFSIAFLILCLTFPPISQATKPAPKPESANDEAIYKVMLLNDELQQASEFVFVWWIPGEFWDNISAVFTDENDRITIKSLKKQFETYNIFLISAVKPSKNNTSTLSQTEIFKTLYLIGNQENKVFPLEFKQIPKHHLELLDLLLKGIFPDNFGEIADGAHFFLFPASISEQQIIDTKKQASFTLGACGNEFIWQTPIQSLLPLLTCPKCGVKNLNRDFKYCPWDGTKLPQSTEF